MARTQNYRDQHQQLLKLAGELGAITSGGRVAERSAEARKLLPEIAGKLKIHLALEDQSLYPELLKHKDDKVRDTAKRFIAEMGGISAAVDKYLNRWATAEAIAGKPAEFSRETSEIISALGQRIQKEDTVLYAMVDRI